MKINDNLIKDIDKSGMRKIIADFHTQFRNSIHNISTYPKIADASKISKVVIFGMGGSAISGDLARNYISVLHPEINIPITVVRNYNPPNWIDSSTLVIAISYSGNTEETLSCLQQSMKKTKMIAGIASGGQLQKICLENELPFLNIPGGLQPRAALGYLFFAVLNFLLLNFCIVCQVSKSMIEFEILADFLEEKSKLYSKIDDSNYAIKIAEKIKDKTAIIYSSSDVLDVVNLRWKGQIQENSKNLAFSNLLPEMNHNEINSYVHPENNLKNMALIFLEDKSDNPKNISRINATKSILMEKCPVTELISSQEDMFLLRIFDLIYLADWVSFYLAILNEEDPTPIPLISKLKNIMSGN